MVKSFSEFHSEKDIHLVESSLARVLHHTKNSNIGLISASRGDKDSKTNHENNKKLEKDLRSHGHGIIHVHGEYTENKGQKDERKVKEHSMLVVSRQKHDGGELLKHLKHYGEKYGQDAILHKAHDEPHAHLHGTKDTDFLKKGHKMNVGDFHPNRASEFVSHLSNSGGKRKFTFSEEIDSIGEGQYENVDFFEYKDWFLHKEKWDSMIFTFK